MSQSNPDNNPVNKGIRITLYKSVLGGRITPRRRDFLLWGSSDFLYIDVFNSLSEFSIPSDKDINVDGLDRSPLTENRHLYIYKDQNINFFPNQELDWIFKNHPENPLIILTLIKANVDQAYVKVKEIANTTPFAFDIFKTLGQSTGVIVFRCKSYSSAINCIVQLNVLSESTYSIAGIQIPEKKLRTKDKILFPILLKNGNPSVESSKSYVSIHYLIKDKYKSQNRVHVVIRNLVVLKQNMLKDLGLDEQDLKFNIYFEVGRFDIEVNIEGEIAYILELLLNSKYGLINMKSKFYQKHVFESHTTWKSLAT